MGGSGVIGESSAHDASSFTFPATRRSSATSAVSSLASRQPSVLARTSMAPSMDDAEVRLELSSPEQQCCLIASRSQLRFVELC